MSRQAARRELGPAAVLSEAEAVRLLPFRDASARAWLREQGLVHHHSELGRYVLWAEVLAALRVPEEVEEPRRTGTLARGGLRR